MYRCQLGAAAAALVCLALTNCVDPGDVAALPQPDHAELRELHPRQHQHLGAAPVLLAVDLRHVPVRVLLQPAVGLGEQGVVPAEDDRPARADLAAGRTGPDRGTWTGDRYLRLIAPCKVIKRKRPVMKITGLFNCNRGLSVPVGV